MEDVQVSGRQKAKDSTWIIYHIEDTDHYSGHIQISFTTMYNACAYVTRVLQDRQLVNTMSTMLPTGTCQQE